MSTPRISVKKKLLVLLIVCILVICGTIVIVGKNQTPYDFLKKSNNNDVIAPAELLYQKTLDSGFSIVFYIDQSGLYRCAMIEDVLLGHRTVGISGSLGIYNSDTYLYSSFASGQTNQNICWGVLTNNDVTEVFLDNESCNIADTAYGFRIFWLTGLKNDTPSLTTNP